MATGIITNVDYYSLPSESLLPVHNKPRYVCEDLMQSMLHMCCNTAHAGSVSCLFAKLATIHVVQKYMTANLLHGKLQVVKVGNMWGDASLHESGTYQKG